MSASDAEVLQRWLNDAAMFYRRHAKSTREMNRASQLSRMKRKIQKKIPTRDDD